MDNQDHMLMYMTSLSVVPPLEQTWQAQEDEAISSSALT